MLVRVGLLRPSGPEARPERQRRHVHARPVHAADAGHAGQGAASPLVLAAAAATSRHVSPPPQTGQARTRARLQPLRSIPPPFRDSQGERAGLGRVPRRLRRPRRDAQWPPDDRRPRGVAAGAAARSPPVPPPARPLLDLSSSLPRAFLQARQLRVESFLYRRRVRKLARLGGALGPTHTATATYATPLHTLDTPRHPSTPHRQTPPLDIAPPLPLRTLTPNTLPQRR